ncbi:TPA: hypothetical protein I8V89_000877 [Corynebacterium striatum]|nr:hypothetical protein [Corynebacterium striatum]HAT1196175.1 hypothetical protein [Corynebacterium striatum]HAT1215100.1 hypothetical protein [Corynebacterium striatum]HAT1248141.1 hypothetical protein [Corynebacterium striatum]HAT1310878.1 hypothetical protein [Corynebacterium striatum]
MTTKNEKTPAGAGNTNEGSNEVDMNSNTHKSSSLELRRAIHKVEAAIANNNRKLQRIGEKAINATPAEYRELDELFGVVQKQNTVLIKQLRALVEELYEAGQREWRAAKKCREEAARHEARKREEIAHIMERDDLSPVDLQYELVARYREGGDYMTVLDAMKAVDDLDLQRAGLTSWGEGVDE